MTAEERYKEAKSRYAGIAVDTDRALDILKEIPVSMHCWQGDDVAGFDYDGPLTGGIQTTGNYPGRARTKLNLHASYAVFEDGVQVDRDRLQPRTGMSSDRGVFC